MADSHYDCCDDDPAGAAAKPWLEFDVGAAAHFASVVAQSPLHREYIWKASNEYNVFGRSKANDVLCW